MSDAKTILPGDFLVQICCRCLQGKRRAHFLMIHTIASLSAVYLDLEFICSPAKLCKAQADNRLHVGKGHFQCALCLNALLRDTSYVFVPCLVSDRYAKRKSIRGWTKDINMKGF